MVNGRRLRSRDRLIDAENARGDLPEPQVDERLLHLNLVQPAQIQVCRVYDRLDVAVQAHVVERPHVEVWNRAGEGNVNGLEIRLSTLADRCRVAFGGRQDDRCAAEHRDPEETVRLAGPGFTEQSIGPCKKQDAKWLGFPSLHQLAGACLNPLQWNRGAKMTGGARRRPQFRSRGRRGPAADQQL